MEVLTHGRHVLKPSSPTYSECGQHRLPDVGLGRTPVGRTLGNRPSEIVITFSVGGVADRYGCRRVRVREVVLREASSIAKNSSPTRHQDPASPVGRATPTVNRSRTQKSSPSRRFPRCDISRFHIGAVPHVSRGGGTSRLARLCPRSLPRPQWGRRVRWAPSHRCPRSAPTR